MQDYRRNGWYALGGALMTGGAAWLVGWGITVASAKKDSTTHFLTPATWGAIAVCAAGLLIILAVMFNWPSKLRSRIRRHEAREQISDEREESGSPLPPPEDDSLSLRNFHAGGDSDFDLNSSARRLAEGGGLSGRAKFRAQHFPGRPEMFGPTVESGGEQQEAPQAEEGPPRDAGPAT